MRENDGSNYKQIPCLYQQPVYGSSKLLVYFHGNAEDLGLSVELMNVVKSELSINTLVIEYPGYGIY